MNRKSLLEQNAYDVEKEDRWWWDRQQRFGLSRRDLMRLLAVGAGAAAVGAVPGFSGKARADDQKIIKPTPSDTFYLHGSNVETRFEKFKGTGYYTSNDMFFVRNHTTTPHLDPATWRLRIDGDGVRNPIELTYNDLLALPSRTETKFVECAGNFRSQYHAVYGTKASGTQWRTGAIGVAEWTGVSLWRVLELAGLDPDAVDFMPYGLDSAGVKRPLPIEKGLEDDTLLVYGMNGQPLPPDHGYPVRLLTPGWVGVCNVKWVGRIEVSKSFLYSKWNTTSYVMFGDAYPDKPVVTSHYVKSAFELPWGGSVAAGAHVLTGRAWSGQGKIDRVDVSFDGGSTWAPAALDSRNIPKAWVQFSIPWMATPGSHHLMARATDSRGNVQPVSVPFNDQGYLFWAIARHPISVV